MERGNFIQVTPFMHVPDIEAALRFFEDILGFKTLFRDGTYAYVHRETVGFRLLQNHGNDGAPPGNRRFCYYIDVRDVDALYAELKPKLDTLPSKDVHGPADKPYNQRELLVLAPDGNLIAFGQPIRS
jgi:catechol 2,3-dioxygenase-like lactoylglutathione lyase family enzyme